MSEKAFEFQVPFEVNPEYQTRVAYFSMEFAVDQALKIYSGGLGFLAGSHMKSAYELRQNLVGIGILWKYGYYDQIRKGDKSMSVLFQEKIYGFLEDTGIRFEINVNDHPVGVKALYLKPEIFNTAPMFLLSTDLPENDYLAKTISHRLYDSNVSTRIAQYILLGAGGAKLLNKIGFEPEVYHLNEAHALPLAFHLYIQYNDIEKVKQSFVFTTHTPEKAGNEEHDISYLDQMGFFSNIDLNEVRRITKVDGGTFNLTLGALRMAKVANAVSRKHGEVSNEMWSGVSDICPILSVTNAQNKKYWADPPLYEAAENNRDEQLVVRKRQLKEEFFKAVADQTGKLFDPEVLTIVWARRFAEYKRPDLIIKLFDRFHELITSRENPLQMIWAGKPYPGDYGAIGVFDNLVHMNKEYMNSAILVSYELTLSKLCKQGADVWLNTPRIPREASGTSGMTAAMNGALNFSTRDGWILEFGKHLENAFLIPEADQSSPAHEQDRSDAEHLMGILKNEIIPAYYKDRSRWVRMVKQSMQDVAWFDSNRMADEYYKKIYGFEADRSKPERT